jgi:DNA replication and repair protein RecF
LRVAARLAFAARDVRIDYVRTKQGSALYENGRSVSRIRDMEGRLLVRVIGENAQNLLEGAPEIRRRFLDWNLFHVEQEYADEAARFHRVWCQRNSWLRQGAPGPAIWDEPYLELAQSITGARSSLVAALNQELDELVRDSALDWDPNLRLEYHPGWARTSSLPYALESSLAQDKLRGYTYHGPKRGDLVVLRDAAGRLGSRGQLKAAVCLIQLAAQRVWTKRVGCACVWLLDDFFSELDARQAKRLWSLLTTTDAQIFATAVDEVPRVIEPPDRLSTGVFHVEQGKVSAAAA